MKKVAVVLMGALFLGACHCTNTCTKCNTTAAKPAAKETVKQEPVKKEAVKPAEKPAPKAVEEKDFAEVASVKTQTAGRTVLSYKEPINFNYNSDVIAESSLDQIKKTADALKKYPNAKVRVAGYTDSYGDANYNIDLSQRRAKAVAMELVRDGVPAKNVTFIGYGEANPVATNKTAAGRYQNRRVELEITNN